MIKTRITELLGIEYPIVQGGMAWVADASLASAVSNAGGLGLISSINASADTVLEEIRKCKKMTNKPFGVNIMLMSPIADKVAQFVIDEQVPIVSTGAGTPAKYMEQWLKAGIKVIPVVASAAYAIRMEKIGAVAVVAEGGEAGGHIGEMNTMALIPQVCDAVSIPVIAAGGIADGRGFAAAMMLGAEGVQIGTRFITATESNAHDNYKQKIIAAGDTDTIVTGKSLGHPVRALKTPFSRKFAQMENDPTQTPETIMEFGSGSLRKAVKDGDEKMGSFMAGQGSGLVKKVQPAKEIILEIVNDARNLLEGSSKYF